MANARAVIGGRMKATEKQKIYQKQYYRDNVAKVSNRMIKTLIALRLEVLTHYCNGVTPFCACCKVNNVEFLSIDHINGGGSRQRKELGISGGKSYYYYLKRNHYPSGYRVLCHNCNQAMGHVGYCPHGNLRGPSYV